VTAESATPEFEHPRFAGVEPVARGRFGTVLRALDRELGRPVAVKLLHSARPEDLASLKNEFRAMRRVLHPGVVRFHELFTATAPWFYTMDLVDGLPADAWWRGAGDGAALADFARQLIDAVRAIHTGGTLHRDLKPANLLVDGDGRLTVVDFGFALATRASAWVEDDHAGTLAYMAPEAMLASSEPASDWYSVGVVLYEMVTGALPPPLATRGELAQRLASSPHSRSATWLGSALPGLLDQDVERRSSCVEELAAALGVRSHPEGIDEPQAPPFVGRDHERIALQHALAACRSGAQVCHVHGPSGIGKSELLARFLDDAIAAGAVVLQGRCHTTERVPYNALDEIVDDLARLLDRLAAGEVLPLVGDEEGRAAAARLFPVLARVVGYAGHVNPEASPQRLRRLGVETLRMLVAALTERAPLVLVLDDVQWGDAESSALLSDLLAAPPDGLLVVLSYRSPDASDGPFLPTLMLDGLGRTELALHPLGRDAVERWVEAATPHQDGAELVRYLVDNAGGSPFLVHELLRVAVATGDLRAPAPFGEILAGRIAALTSDERAMLEAATVAARPTDCRVLAEAVRAPGAGRLLAEHLAARSLLRIRTTPEGPEASVYHDRIRELLHEMLAPDVRRELHLGLAEALEQHGGVDVDAERLFVHYRGAERREAAGRWAEQAARRASESLAFERAASLLREALALADGPEARARRASALGDALVNGGRGFDGAEAYQDAAGLLDAVPLPARGALPARRDLLSRAAQHLVRSGRMVEGKELFTQLLGEVRVRMPQTADKAMREALLRRVRFLLRGWQCRPRERAEMDAEVRDRLDLLWDSSVCFSLTNFPISHALGSAHLLEALERGDRWGVMRAVGVEAAFEAALGTGYLRRRAARMLDFIDTLVRPEIDDVFWQQSVRIFRSVTCWNQGRWQESAIIAEEYADVIQRQCPGRDWEVAVALLHLFGAKAYMGEMRYLAERIPPALADAVARGDDFAANFYRLGEHALYHLAVDDPAGLRAAIAAAKASWPNEPHHLHHYHHVVIETYLALYEGREQDAWDFIVDRWATLKEAQFLSIEIGRITFHHVRARAALALAARRTSRATRERDPEVRRLLREVERSMRTIGRSGLAPARGMVPQLAAGVAHARGDEASASRLLREAAQGYRAAGMDGYAAACEVVDGGEAQALRTEGVRDMRRFGGTLVPGWG